MRYSEFRQFRGKMFGTAITIIKVMGVRPAGRPPVPYALMIYAEYGPNVGGRWFVECEPDEWNTIFEVVCQRAPTEIATRHSLNGAGHALMWFGINARKSSQAKRRAC